MLEVKLSKQAEGFLRSLPAKQAAQIARKINELAASSNVMATQLLQGYEPLRRLKTGEYRVIFLIENNLLDVKLIGKRNGDEVYKVLGRIWKG